MILKIEAAIIIAQIIILSLTWHWIKNHVLTHGEVQIVKRVVEQFRPAFEEADSRKHGI